MTALPIEIKITRIKEKAVLPQKKTKGAAGCDVSACLDEPVSIKPFERKSIPTGLIFEIPERYHISLRPRSGLALKHGITLPNAPGTIDSDYRGELMILLINLGNETYSVNHGDRIAQLLLEPVLEISFREVSLSELSDTKRGEGGFGSTE